jgi:hypothetical protein
VSQLQENMKAVGVAEKITADVKERIEAIVGDAYA